MLFSGINLGLLRFSEFNAVEIDSVGASMTTWSAGGPRGSGLRELGPGLGHGDWLCSEAAPAWFCIGAAGSLAAFWEGCGVPLGSVHGDVADTCSVTLRWRLVMVATDRGDFHLNYEDATNLMMISFCGRWRSQVRFFWMIAYCEDSVLLVMRYLKLDFHLEKDQINVHLIAHPSMQVGCVIAATFDETIVLEGWAARCFSFWLQLLSLGSGNVNCIFILEFGWNGCSCITSTSSGMYHLLYLVEHVSQKIANWTVQFRSHNLFKSCGCTMFLIDFRDGTSRFYEQDHLSMRSKGCFFITLEGTWFSLSDDQVVQDAVPLPFGLCHRRCTTTPLSLIPRFDGGDISRLSSVMVILNFQLNPSKPRVHTPDRPSGEPPTGHQLVWSTLEALKVCRCSNIESMLSTDDRSLFGFICNLRYRLRLFRSSFFLVVHLGTFDPCSTFCRRDMMYPEL